jgi:hypothetical protein
LENSEQRPAPETRVQSSEMPQIADQRPVPDSLTCGNVDAFPFWGTYNPEGFEPPRGGIKIRCLTAWLFRARGNAGGERQNDYFGQQENRHGQREKFERSLIVVLPRVLVKKASARLKIPLIAFG